LKTRTLALAAALLTCLAASALAQDAAPADPFPTPNPKNFTAASPSADTVDSFLKSIWGYDPNRIWRVEAILTTAAPGVSKVVVYVSDKSPNARMVSSSFFVTPDGKHAIADGSTVINFGAKPFADLRAMLQSRVTGAARGPASKDLMLVEFADLQCPHCKEAQPTMDQIVKDFPNARVVFQPFPLVEVHASAYKAAAYGVCVQQQSDDAFFKYSQAVFDTQDALTPDSTDATLTAAVRLAGLDPAAVAACADTPSTKSVVDADIKLAEDAGVDQTPMLAINGHLLPLGQIPYETLKQIIVYQAQLDGVATGARADILAPPPPSLTTLPK